MTRLCAPDRYLTWCGVIRPAYQAMNNKIKSATDSALRGVKAAGAQYK